MSTRLGELSLPFSESRLERLRAFLVAAAVTLAAIALFALSFAFGITALNAGRIVPGTVVAGVPLGGLDRVSAEVRLREKLPSLSAGHLTVRIGETDRRITYREIGRDYDIAAMLDQAMAVGRESGVVNEAQDQLRIALRGAEVAPRVIWNEAVLEQKLLAIASAAEKPAVDATIVREGARFVVLPSAPGVAVDVSGAWQQALAAVGSLSPADAVVSVEPTVVPPAVTTAQAQVAVDRAERVAATDLTITGDGVTETISADTIRGWMRLEDAGSGSWTLVVERQPVAQFVAQMSAAVYKAPVDASFKFKGDTPAPVPGAPGLELDVETTTETVYSALTGRADGAPTSSVALTSRAVEPNFTTAMAIELAPRVRKVSEWTTPYTPSERNFFGANIMIPTDLIDGTAVPAGAKFDFWATVGSLSNLEGIGPGGAIIHGRTNPTGALGGGICSVSTTLFNAALRAGLEMGARRNHAYYIDRYPTGLDATVWRSGSAVQNMTWTNDTSYPVIVRGINNVNEAQTRATVTFELWSLPIERTVTFSEPIIEGIKLAADFWEYSDDTLKKEPLPPGEQQRLEYPTNGFQSSVTRTVRDASGALLHEDTFQSKYVRVDGITLIGRTPTDPADGTLVEREDGLEPIQPPEAPELPEVPEEE